MTPNRFTHAYQAKLWLGLLLLFSLVLTACGDGATPTPAVSSSTAATTSGAGTDAGAGVGGKTKISFWTQNRHDETYMRQQVDLFNQTNKDNIEVEYTVRAEDYSKSIALAWQAGNGPDLFTGNTLDIPSLVKAKQIEPLDNYINDETKTVLGQAGRLDNYNVFDGKLYCLVNYGTTYRLIYNKDLFQKAGIASPPVTIAQMVADAKKITEVGKADGAYGFSINLKTPNNSWKRSLYSMAQRSGLYYYDYKKGQFDFNGYMPYLNAFIQLVKDGSMAPEFQASDIDAVRKAFAQGKIGMYLSISAEPSVYISQFPTTVNWAAAPQPTLDDKPMGAAPIEPVYWAGISAQSKNKQAAAEVLNWFFRKDFLVAYQEKGFGNSILPAVSKVAQAPTLKNYNYFLPDATDAVWPVIPAINKVDGKDKDTVMADIVYGIETDPTKALSDLTARYNSTLNSGIAVGTYPKVLLPDFIPLSLQSKNQ